MTNNQLLTILNQLPNDAEQITIIWRRSPIISCSIGINTTIPEGWRQTLGEPRVQQTPHLRRIIYNNKTN